MPIETGGIDRMRWRALADNISVAQLQRLIANYKSQRDEIADSDLDNEQPISITWRGQLGDIRNAERALQCFSALRHEMQERYAK